MVFRAAVLISFLTLGCSAGTAGLEIPPAQRATESEIDAARPQVALPHSTLDGSVNKDCESGRWCLRTIAGGGEPFGDGPATEVFLSSVTALAVHPDGRVYFSDRNTSAPIGVIENGYLRRFENSEITFRAKPDRFWLPDGLAIDRDGGLLISDLSHRVRRLEGGELFPVVGQSALPARHNHFPTGGHVDGPLYVAELDVPIGIAMDSRRRMLIAEAGNRMLRWVENQQVSTLMTLDEQPWGVAVDGQDRFYVLLRDSGTILTVEDRVVRILESDDLNLASPHGIAVDDEGRLFVADTGHGVIKMIDKGVVTIIAGGGAQTEDGLATSVKISRPHSVAVGPDGSIYIGESYPGRIRRLYRNE